MPAFCQPCLPGWPVRNALSVPCRSSQRRSAWTGGKGARHHQEGYSACDADQNHIDDAQEARQMYWEDAEKKWEWGTIYIAADMIKAFMLPQLPIKDCFFKPRLSCYNKTSTPSMPSDMEATRAVKQERCKYSACHEGVAGRGADDAAAAYHLHLTTVCRDVKHTTIWLDNCAAQNKSWILLTTLLKTVHSQETATETITLIFFFSRAIPQWPLTPPTSPSPRMSDGRG